MDNYQQRWYRALHDSSSYSCEIAYRESDIFISSDTPLSPDRAFAKLKEHYEIIAGYCRTHPDFSTTLSPLAPDPDAPLIIQDMISASKQSETGPFSCVAGAISEYLGRDLVSGCEHLIIENGGDLFVRLKKDIVLGVHLGRQYEPDTLRIRLPEKGTMGICSSSATMGHSLSLGRADMVTVIADTAVLADAFATALCNKVKTASDIDKVIAQARSISCIKGLIIACQGALGFWGNFQIAE